MTLVSKSLRLVLAITLAFSLAAADAQPARKLTPWKAGAFRGLIIGRSTESDMRRVLGNPDATDDKTKDPSLVLYRYNGKGDLQGTLEVAVRRRDKVISNIAENLPVALPRTPAYKRFGDDYRVRHYAFAECAAREGLAPLYHDTNGPIEMIEYPQRGLVLALDKYGYDIASIIYTSQPPGNDAPPSCVKRASRGAVKR